MVTILGDIFAHGILVQEDTVPPTSLIRIATTKLPIFSSFTLTILDSEGESVNEVAVKLSNVHGAHNHSDYFEEYDLRYCVLSTLYHLNRLIELYVENTQLFERLHPKKDVLRGNIHGPNAYYEVDAFLTAARRIYDSISKLLWKHYRKGEKGRWRSIRPAVNDLNKIPESFATNLKNSWNSLGELLTDYRDCAVHYIPLNKGIETCWLERYDGRWGMSVKLPTNPDSQSRKNFDFDGGPEALAYCHHTTTHLVKLCAQLMALPEISHFMANPK